MSYESDSLRKYLKDKDYVNAIDQYLSIIESNKDDQVIVLDIIERIKKLMETDVLLTLEQNESIKSLIDSDNEEIEELSIEIYLSNLKRNQDLINSEIDYCIKKSHDVEELIRDHFLDFIIEIFPLHPDFQYSIIEALITDLNDKSWNNRLKIIDFLNKSLSTFQSVLKEHHQDIEIIFDEKDLDVVREVQEFLYNFILSSYTPTEFKDLILTIPQREWYAQKKILWLVSKLGCTSIDLVEPSILNVVELLDYQDNLIQNQSFLVLEELITAYPDICDSAFFLVLKQEDFDNIELIEDLIKISILEGGIARFTQLFMKITQKDFLIIKNIYNALKKVGTDNPQLMFQIYSQLTDEIFDYFNTELYEIYRRFLKINPQYTIYLIVYSRLQDKAPFLEGLIEQKRQELLNFLTQSIPELGYHKLIDWINLRIRNGTVELVDICNAFEIDKLDLIEILKNLVQKGLLEALISEDKIQALPQLAPESLIEDLSLMKKFDVQYNMVENALEIHISVKITNISGSILSKLNLILNFPESIFQNINYSDEMIKYIENLGMDESAVFEWILKKRINENITPQANFLKVLIMYQKDGKLSTLNKKLDLLVI